MTARVAQGAVLVLGARTDSRARVAQGAVLVLGKRITITSIDPAAGSFAGGTTVTIEADRGLANVTAVRFGGNLGTSLNVIDDTELTVVTPSHGGGVVDVTLERSPGGTLLIEDGYEFIPPEGPTIDTIDPVEGRVTGGTVVTITGTGFSGTSGVLFGAVPGTSLNIISSTELEITTPEHPEGLVGITLLHPEGNAFVDDAFTFTAVPVRVTQVPIHVVHMEDQEGRITQIPISVIYIPPKPGSVTQIPINTSFILEPEKPRALLPTWPIVERWSWLTTVVKSISGREQRMAVRVEPHQSFQYSLALLDDEDRQIALYTFWRYIGRHLAYPLFAYSVPLLSTASIGSIYLDVDTDAGNFRIGERVAVFSRDMSLYTVLETTGLGSPDGIELEQPLEVELSGDLLVAPAPMCRINDGHGLTMNPTTGQSEVMFTSVATREILRPGQTTSIDTFAGLPILPQKYISSNVSERVTRNIEVLDNAITLPQDYKTWINPQIQSSRSYLIENEDLDYWRKFADTIKGSRGVFLAPSHREDFHLSTSPALGATTLFTADTRVADFMYGAGNKFLRIQRADGSVIYRAVSDAILLMDRTVRIVLTQSIGSAPGNNQIERLSIMSKVRLADDTIELSHMPNHVVVSMTVATVDR